MVYKIHLEAIYNQIYASYFIDISFSYSDTAGGKSSLSTSSPLAASCSILSIDGTLDDKWDPR